MPEACEKNHRRQLGNLLSLRGPATFGRLRIHCSTRKPITGFRQGSDFSHSLAQSGHPRRDWTELGPQGGSVSGLDLLRHTSFLPKAVSSVGATWMKAPLWTRTRRTSVRAN